MNKRMRELLQEIEAKNQEAAQILSLTPRNEEERKNYVAKVVAITDEIKNLKEEYEAVKALYESSKFTTSENATPQNDYKKEFINAIRTKFRNAMSVGVDEDGGYTVPQDIQTRINELRQARDALERFVTVEQVNTMTGSRVFKKRAQQTGFVEVDEGGTIVEQATPQFTVLPYAIKKYAGFFKSTNELLRDSDQAIENTLVKWISDESRVTRNKLILAELGKKAKTAIASINDLKGVINEELDPAFWNTTVIITNQTGWNWLDNLEDNQGRPLLQPSPVEATRKLLFGMYPVAVFSNKDLPNAQNGSTKAPMIIGDLKEAIILFDRMKLTIDVSSVAMDAFETDSTYFRAIERLKVATRDDEAFVYGEITIA